MSKLRIYDSLSRSIVDFVPRDPGRVSIYACGLTPQAPSHLGHMRGAVLFDVIRRWFEYLGYEVNFVQNFTDIDDKIIRKSKEEGIPPEEVAKKYSKMYLEDLTALGVRPAKWVYVTENIPVIIEMIQKLIERGAAYVVDGDVYFRVLSFPQYGKLSRRKLSEMQAGARIEVDERKEHPMDFALWKAAKPGEPSWDSPWGKGRPGWHIECSALSLKELGPNFDIHAGGVDLVFPHHENEIAQSEAYLGKPEFARIWMHWGAVRLAEKKMSKSEGNVMETREVLERFSPQSIRLFLLGTSYRSPIEYTETRMHDSESASERIRIALQRVTSLLGKNEEEPKAEDYVQRFTDAMNDDFNTAGAIGVMYEAIGEINELLSENPKKNEKRIHSLRNAVEWFLEILGLTMPKEEIFTDGMTEKVLSLIIKWRNELRAQKQFAFADKIREDLKHLGILLEDTTEGTIWRKV
ncbi:MAG TPA: cysteine--tRNA ligase [Fimbriimonadales bacterium]|nr:cysteine--tRNA ligase [Fimbriimonadales bacterium]